MAKIHEWQDKYCQWWKGKLVITNSGQPKRVKDIKLYGPPSFVYGAVEFIFDDGTTETITTDAYKPRKSDVKVVYEVIK